MELTKQKKTAKRGVKTNELTIKLPAISENEAVARAIVGAFAARLDPTLEELAECIPDTSRNSLADEVALKLAVNSFLTTLDERTRVIFMRRYWYMMPIARVAYESGMTESNVKTTLHRTRLQFKEHLEKEGIII